MKNNFLKLKGGRIKTSAFKPVRIGDFLFNNLLLISGIFVILLVLGFLITLFFSAMPSIKKFGLPFFINNIWEPNNEIYGAYAFIIGTLLTSIIALIISIPFSLSISILLAQYLKTGFLSNLIKVVTELLAGIPSVIYGFWGFIFLSTIVQWFAITFFDIHTIGYGVFTASLVLSIMIIPYCASISREVIDLVPKDLQEAAYALGSTKFEVIVKVVIPYAMSGIFAGVILALGRALGETMAVTMVIGNRNALPLNLFSPANTIASVIANNFNEADGLMLSSLIELGFILMLITTVINFAGKYIIKRFTVK